MHANWVDLIDRDIDVEALASVGCVPGFGEGVLLRGMLMTSLVLMVLFSLVKILLNSIEEKEVLLRWEFFHVSVLVVHVSEMVGDAASELHVVMIIASFFLNCSVEHVSKAVNSLLDKSHLVGFHTLYVVN